MTQPRWRRPLVAAIFCCCASTPALAGGLNVFPIRLQLQGADDVQQLSLTNAKSDSPLLVQIELYRWTQYGGEEQLEPSRELLATPPMLEIAPQQRRQVRIGARQFPKAVCETAYRLVITEIPPRTGPQPPLRFRTRMRLPLFARNGDQCRPELHWQRRSGQLTARNTGNGHIQFQSLQLQQGEREWPLQLLRVGYVLAGSEVSFPLPAELGPGPVRLIAQSRDGQQAWTLPARD